MATVTPGPHTHEQWLGLVQPVGLVVAPAVLSGLQLFPNQSTPYLSARQRQLEGLMEEVEGPANQSLAVVQSFALLSAELLDWGDADLVAAAELESVPEVVLAEYGETLRPTHGVPKFEAEGLQALVLDLTQWRNIRNELDPQWGRDFDAPWNPTGHGWDATPQQRFERLLKETEHPIGILFNGAQLRLIHAPRGESSGWLTMPLEPMAEVAGRPMLGALELLLGVDRLFGGNPEQRLPALLAASRKNQNEVSTRLAEQVLEALWELLLGFDEAERIAREAGGTVLGELPKSEEGQKHLYGGLITVLLRLVFLLYAEDEGLMPKDSLYGQHYSVSALADRLRKERFEHQGAMADRRGAWASLLSLFRLVYDGGGASPNYLPARHGDLFEPDTYPFLEGREPGSHYTDDILTNVPSISDDVVEKVLTRLLWLADENRVAQRLNYRSLDVEQIGSVYEGIMGFTVEGANAPSVGITYRPPRQKITITLVVDAEKLLVVNGGKREKWLDEQAGVALKLPAKVKEALKQASSLAELCLALGNRLSPHTPNGLAPGSLILQPTSERRRSGSHYTPRALTEPIVLEAFRPWLERCGGNPTAKQILDLKVCDPAMGSGAFLVAVCRYLAGLLVAAWEDKDGPGFPPEFRQEWDKDLYARRLIAQRCIYGVDKNPFAVNLAKLSLWLVTLSKDLPFTFVDHALKCGDSLVGYSVREIEAATEMMQTELVRQDGDTYVQACTELRQSFSEDTLDDADYERKRLQLQQQIKVGAMERLAGDLMVAAFLAESRPAQRANALKQHLSYISGAFVDQQLPAAVQEILDRLKSGDKGITPFHWDLEFPEVFSEERGGFNVFVGNPPFLGGNRIYPVMGEIYPDWLRDRFANSGGKGVDLVCYFFRNAYELLAPNGCLGLIATSTIAEGDTRLAGLKQITSDKGSIYSAIKKMPWPGVAAVSVSIVHVCKNTSSLCLARFNSYLLSSTIDQDPQKLISNRDTAFRGCVIYGDGFIYKEEPSDVNAGCPEDAVRLLREDPRRAQVLKPLIGGKELTTSPSVSHERYAICFGDMTLDEAAAWPDLLEVVRRKVKPMRDLIEGDYSIAKRRREYWWQYGTYTPALYSAIEEKKNVLAISQVTTHIAFAVANANTIFSNRLIIVAPGHVYNDLAIMQSSLHQVWAIRFGASQDERFVYGPEECFETFPFPAALLESNTNDPAHDATRQSLEAIGERYHKFRAELMIANNEGLTSTYNRFHDPAETSPAHLQLRELHSAMDQAVLHAYGWSDLATACGFGLDYLDIEEDAQVPDELQERINSGELFFWDAGDALDFQGQLQAYGAITGRRKLPWRYRWPDAVRDDVLARLLALNAERYEEEVRLGLHTKAGKQAAKARGKRKKKTPSAPEFELTNEPYQTDLKLF